MTYQEAVQLGIAALADRARDLKRCNREADVEAACEAIRVLRGLQCKLATDEGKTP